MTSVNIRKPVLSDAFSIVECRREAILNKGISHYSKEMLIEWAAETSDEKIQKVKEDIQQPDWIYLVAEANDKIIGFGIAHPKENLLGAVYVQPNKYGQVGKFLLSELLKSVQAEGCTYLVMEASINAEKFYVDNGFTVIWRGVHKMKSGAIMDNANMRIDF